MTTAIEVRELPARFAEIIARLESGSEVVLLEDAVPRARLLPLTAGKPRVPGLHAGSMTTAADFDAPLPEEFWTP